MARATLPTLQAPAGSTLLADFTDGTHAIGTDVIIDRTAANATGRVYAIDTTNGVTISFTGGTSNQYASISYAPASPMSFTDTDWIAIEIDYPEGNSSFGGQFYDSIVVFAVTESGGTFTNYGGPKTFQSGADKMPHRMILALTYHELLAAGTGGSGITAGVVGQINIRLVVHPSAQNIPAKIYIRKIWKGKNRTQVALCWDDAYSAQYSNAYSVMTTAGFNGTLFPSSSYIGASGKLTAAQVQAMYAAGWTIGVQEKNDVTDQMIAYGTLTRSTTTATFTPVTQQVNPYITAAIAAGDPIVIRGCMYTEWNGSFSSAGASVDPSTGIITFTCAGTETTPAVGIMYVQRTTAAAWMANVQSEIAYWAALGINSASKFIAYSGGNVSDLVQPYAAQVGFKLGRSTAAGTTPMQRCFDPRLSTSRSLLQLPAGLMDNQTGATCLGYVDTAESRGGSIVLYGHNQAGSGSSSAMATAEFDILINGDNTHVGLKQRVAQGRIDVVTFSDLYNKAFGLSGLRARASGY